MLEARILEGDGQVSRPGLRISRPLVVEVTDETGTVVEGALVSFRLPEDGPSGTFRNGLKTDISKTDSEGHVELRHVQVGGLAGQFQIRMTVASGGARTGVISNQYVAPGGRQRPGFHFGTLSSHPRVLMVGGLVLASLAAGYAKQKVSAGGVKAQLPPTIGPPTVVIGKP